jgi:hypothetical protein
VKVEDSESRAWISGPFYEDKCPDIFLKLYNGSFYDPKKMFTVDVKRSPTATVPNMNSSTKRQIVQ